MIIDSSYSRLIQSIRRSIRLSVDGRCIGTPFRAIWPVRCRTVVRTAYAPCLQHSDELPIYCQERRGRDRAAVSRLSTEREPFAATRSQTVTLSADWTQAEQVFRARSLQASVSKPLFLLVNIHEFFDELFDRFVFSEVSFHALHQLVIEFDRSCHRVAYTRTEVNACAKRGSRYAPVRTTDSLNVGRENTLPLFDETLLTVSVSVLVSARGDSGRFASVLWNSFGEFRPYRHETDD